jgi:two-component system OmpR family response regulator
MTRRSILIVDDDEATCTVLKLALGAEGYECRTAHSLRQAIIALNGGPPPDLILLDLLLPDANGSDLLEHLAARPALRNTPVIIMSAWGKAQEIAQGLQLQTLLKPFSLEQAHQLIGRLTQPA